MRCSVRRSPGSCVLAGMMWNRLRHPDREALPDPEVLALARAERRAVVTNNLRDFRLLHREAITPGGAGHFGMVFIPGDYRRTKAGTGRIIATLETILAQHPGEEDL